MGGLENGLATKTALTVIWEDGGLTTGDSFRELEDNIRAAQWDTFDHRHEFRQEMRHRCFVHTGQWPKPAHTSRAFIQGLAELGMFLLVEE